jgi:hypothetical protein
MLLKRMGMPAAMALAALLAQLPGAQTTLASPSTDIAQAEPDQSIEPEESAEDAAENLMLEKADVAAAIGYGEAHLRAAKELAGSGNPAEAESHLTQVRAFFGPEMSDSLAEAGVPSLAEAVAATATGGPGAVDAAIVAFTAAREGVATGVPDQARYALKVAVALLYFALDEYRTWINEPGAETVVDYQGARAMAQLAGTLAEAVRPAVAARSQSSATGIANAMATILGAFPETTPPAKPKVLEGDMTALINTVNEYSEGF